MKIIITFGTFDMFHYGHVRILERARSLGDRLIVGLSTDEFNLEKKKRKPIFTFKHRKAILESLRCVDEVFPEESLELKSQYIKDHRGDLLVMGDDWEGKFDEVGVDVVYLERTRDLSTTDYINNIVDYYK